MGGVRETSFFWARGGIELSGSVYPSWVIASLGVVTFPEQSMDVTDLLHFADLAMYQSKKQGKNCCSFYNTDIYV